MRDNLQLCQQEKNGLSLLLGAASDRRHDEVTRTGINRQILAVLGGTPKGHKKKDVSRVETIDRK